ncbi:DUF1028 domain-containing protein [Poritiphilus flavus]|uniref:DUF1028 domain-containing protein n=1 Tax=Poritiphilus flavus TaxID=2697053 RepID=A0A6L9EB96_9FLAO|nr:DUF1028 domain-containing protein [Poritiphilus flavus]NAS11954.1 DUF1028 domain-containing protein [Poritiphilus flavus]
MKLLNENFRMKDLCIAIKLLFLSATFSSLGQNLPSLVSDKNINATFAVLAYDENAREWGVAVATNNIYVGNSTVYIEPGLGAFSVIAETEPRYALEGFRMLREGKSIEEAILEVKNKDEEANYRQVAGIDANGNVFAFTGKSLKYWNGMAGELVGSQYVVLGNQLADSVLDNMATTFETARGTLAQRLLKSLLSGQKAGGQLSGKQSAALVVKGLDNEWFNQIDLRVDNSKKPFEELKTLVDYHYGRIRLNQANYAWRAGNPKRAKQKLEEAESMLQGWTGMYPRIARVHMLMGNEYSAVQWIKRGLKENRDFTVYLPSFYLLKGHSELKSLIDPETFSIKDWESALGMLSNLGRETELITLAKELIAKQKESSYLYFLLGRSYYYEKEESNAIKYLEIALKMDAENIEARNLLDKIQSE